MTNEPKRGFSTEQIEAMKKAHGVTPATERDFYEFRLRTEAQCNRELINNRDAAVKANLERSIPKLYREAGSNDLHPSLAEWDGTQSVYLYGPSGTGKTFQLAALTQRAAELGQSVAWFDAIGLFEKFRNSQRNPEAYPTAALLAGIVGIDDLGKQRATEYVNEQLFHVVNSAYQEERVLLITSELPLTPTDGFKSSISNAAGIAIARRLSEMCQGGLLLNRGWWKS